MNHLWSPAPIDLVVADREVHVWRAQREPSSSQVEWLLGILTEDEITRANRFSFERDRQRFVAARVILRSILSRYIVISPGQIRFNYNAYGKPFLAPEFSSDQLSFNLSHSGSMALYAITRNREIGIDIERIRSEVEHEEITKQFFSANEVAMLGAMPNEKKLEAFYTCWTRKEAYIKARGKGLSLPLNSFDVFFAPRGVTMSLMTEDEPQTHSPWTILDLEPGPGYTGALAVKGTGCRMRYWEWNQYGPC